MIPRPLRPQAIAAAIALAACAQVSLAQTPAAPTKKPSVRMSPELLRYREKFEAALTQRLEPAKDAYTGGLRELELQRALSEDYEGALRAKSKRLAVAEATRDAGERDAPDNITLPLSQGRRHGSSIHYDSKRSALTGFSSPGQFITWDVMMVKPGIYRVLFTYGCGKTKIGAPDSKDKDNDNDGPTTGGSFTFEEDTNLNTGEDRLLRHTVYPTGGWDKLVTRNIGRLRITGTTSTLKLTTLEPLADGLMALRSIRLMPYVEQGSPGNPLTKVRRQYNEKITELVADEFERYIADLKDLEEQLAIADRIRETLAVKAERTKFERQTKDPAKATRKITTPR